MADENSTQKVKIVDYAALKKYDELIKEWFKSQLVYATEEDVTNLFGDETNSDPTQNQQDTNS